MKTQTLQRPTKPQTDYKVQIGDVVNILRPDMVSPDKSYQSTSRPHVVVEIYPEGDFLCIPFSTSCDGWGERVIDELFPKSLGGRTEDGWLCPNRVKSFWVSDLQETERVTFLKWKQGHINTKTSWFDLIYKLTTRWVNFKDRNPHFRPSKPYPVVQSSSFTDYDY